MANAPDLPVDVGYTEPRNHPLRGRRNLFNATITLLAPIPAVVCATLLFGWFDSGEIPPDPGWIWPRSADQCAALLLHHPILAANVFFFVFVDLQFWLIALAQRSSWLIDPYWTLLPPLLALFFLANPLAGPNVTRAVLASLALAIWSIRLTYNYFRREQGRFGHREDWRYAKMRIERPLFWAEQFFVVHVAQHVMLVGLSLPFWAISASDAPITPADFAFFILALVGIAIAHVADTQLDRFMSGNAARVKRGEAKIQIFDRGLWRLSRHPNYFGEQLYWWSIAGFGVVCGETWVIAGTLFNSIVLAAVTVMTERRMRAIPERREAFEAYCRRTSAWVPWPPGKGS